MTAQVDKFTSDARPGSLWQSTSKKSYSYWYDPDLLLAKNRVTVDKYFYVPEPDAIIMYLGNMRRASDGVTDNIYLWHQFLVDEQVVWAGHGICKTLKRVR